MRRHVAVIAAAATVGLSGCGGQPDPQTGSGVAHVHISITGGGDTVGFRIPVRARRCADDRGDRRVDGDGDLRDAGTSAEDQAVRIRLVRGVLGCLEQLVEEGGDVIERGVGMHVRNWELGTGNWELGTGTWDLGPGNTIARGL